MFIVLNCGKTCKTVYYIHVWQDASAAQIDCGVKRQTSLKRNCYFLPCRIMSVLCETTLGLLFAGWQDIR